jgi:hypothetical protein
MKLPTTEFANLHGPAMLHKRLNNAHAAVLAGADRSPDRNIVVNRIGSHFCSESTNAEAGHGNTLRTTSMLL